MLYRYCSADGAVDERSNINGAAQSIAGIVNDRGNVLGMMPHPENHVEDIMGCTDGRGLFAGLVAHLEARRSAGRRKAVAHGYQQCLSWRR